MSNSKFKPRIEVVSGAKTGRRHWSDYEKLKIVQESLQDGVVQAQLARRHGVTTPKGLEPYILMIYWLYLL
jgi:transposase-like protein